MEKSLANKLLESVLKFTVEAADLKDCSAERGLRFQGFDEAGWLWLNDSLAILLPESGDEACFLKARIKLNSPILARLLTAILEDHGFKVQLSKDGKEVFLKLRCLDELLWLLSEKWREQLSSAFSVVVRRLEL